ncbi:LysR family transcriptional regulator [Microbacterium hominis]|uniref:LysR family transcriptional regulator n=1 Tax=Microbacterium hominis TaxID=162426 RepID=A0A7D4TEQ1_9MICO|nr:LysR family transcriptional regulator [Microbacterium hominis]QKJ18121.1 LysR family transcriptional regulator [Microbacterium hominis]
MLDLKRLRLLRELHMRGTLAAVADALSYSPSAVSQHLSQLEREAGVELVRRVGRGVRLTPAGEQLVARAEELLETMEQAEAELRAIGEGPSGTVRLAVFQSAMLALLPAALRAMREHAPRVRVEVYQREPESALRETWMREFDLVVAEQYPAHSAPHHSGLDRRALLTDRIRLAVGGELADPVRTLADTAELPWVMEPRGAASRHFAEQACRTAGFEPDVRYETADLQAHVRLVESGNAVALLPDLIWASADPRCALLGLAGAPRRTIFTSARRAGAEFPAVSTFRAALDQVASDLEVE